MSNLDTCFSTGKEIVSEAYGDFQNEPEEFGTEKGLIEEATGGYTRSTIPTTEQGRIIFQDDDAIPQEIVLDETLVNEYPRVACKTLLHELAEWRSAEEVHSNDVIDGNTDVFAEMVEGHLCRETNEQVGEEICTDEWLKEYET